MTSREQHGTRTAEAGYGRDLTFWGGGCDAQHILPHGTPDQVREDARRRLGVFAPGGGYVWCPVHNIMAGVPPENIVAALDAAYEFGGGVRSPARAG